MLLAFPLGMALAGLLLARWRQAVVVVGTLTAVFLWWQLTNSEPSAEQTLTIAGYSFALTEMMQELLRLLYGITAVLFALTWVWPSHPHFIPAALTTIVFFTTALMSPNLLIGATALCLGLAVLAIAIQAGRPQATPVALRLLLFAVLAMLFFVLLDWLLPFGQTSSPVRLVVLIALLLLGGFPFFMWVNRLVIDAPLATVVFVLGVGQTAVLAFLFQFLASHDWLVADVSFRQLLRWSGVATALIAGLLSIHAREARQLLGAFVLLDMAFALITLTFPVTAGWETAVMLLLVRVISLLLAMVGLHLLEERTTHAPFCLLIFAYGGLSLLGLPLTIGFGGRWVVITAVAQQTSQISGEVVQAETPWLALFLLLALAASTYALFRFLIYQYAPSDSQNQLAEPLWQRIGLSILFIITLVLAAFPQPLLAYAHLFAALLQ